MFGPLRSGYILLLTIVAGIWVIATSTTGYPLTTYLKTLGRGGFMALWILPPVLWFSSVGIITVWRGTKRPLKAMVRVAVRNRFWLARGFLFSLLLIPLTVAFTAFKRSIPRVVPFYADPIFADADRILFLNHEPWEVSHALFGPTMTIFLDRIYLLWFPVSAIMLGCFFFTKDQRFQLRGLLTYVLVWFLLGSLLATLLSSVGPVYYEDFFGSDRFVPLLNRLEAQGNLKAPIIQAGLIRGFGGSFIGSGISAMPSLHVGIAFLAFLASNRKIRPVALVYATTIWIASFHLAWHYAVDGIVSVVAVSGIWLIVGWYVDRLSRKPGAEYGDPRQATLET